MTEHVAPPALRADPALVAEVTAFLTMDAELLDEWRLPEWLALFTPDCTYLVPTTDRPHGDADVDLFFVRDDWFLLSQRVDAIMNGTAWAESPRSTTQRMVANVRATEADGAVHARENWVVYRSVRDRLDVYHYVLELELVRGGEATFEIRRRLATLSLAQLRPHGRLSIIL